MCIKGITLIPIVPQSKLEPYGNYTMLLLVVLKLYEENMAVTSQPLCPPEFSQSCRHCPITEASSLALCLSIFSSTSGACSLHLDAT